MADSLDPSNHRNGILRITEDGSPDIANVDTSKIQPSILLVKDYGIYLMSNGLPRLPDLVRETSSLVCFSEESNPHEMPFHVWYENAVDIMGEHDSSEIFPVEWFTSVVEKNPEFFSLRVFQDSIEFFF